MKILVTGGAGFIGANFIKYSLKAHTDDEIICVDKLTYCGNLESLSEELKNPRFRFIKADICDAEAIGRIFEKERPDTVVHFAAESHVDRSIADPQIFVRTNIIGTQNLLEAARKYETGRFHQVGTDEVYGDLPLDRPDMFFTEDLPLKPSSPYSASKAGADFLVQAYHRTFGVNVSLSRCSNNYGPYQFPEKMIPLMIANALADKPLPVY
ncbi:MAG: GDP-mannose 4,6-dehydratase, partial [Lachnospiraceae bacterium]|nr:GDP-mannose 4,6-dehydratase [Lachnospiraceae bacterium]